MFCSDCLLFKVTPFRQSDTVYCVIAVADFIREKEHTDRGEQNRTYGGKGEIFPLPDIGKKPCQNQPQCIEQTNTAVNVIRFFSVKGRQHTVDHSGYKAHKHYGNDQKQRFFEIFFGVRRIGQRIFQNPVPRRFYDKIHDKRNAENNADDKGDRLRHQILYNKL